MSRASLIFLSMLVCIVCSATAGAEVAPRFTEQRASYLAALASVLAEAAQDHGRLRAKQTGDLERAADQSERKGHADEAAVLRSLARRTALDGRLDDLLAEVELERALLMTDPALIAAVTDFRIQAGAIGVPEEIVEAGMPAVPALLEGLRNETQPAVRAFIVNAIRRIGYTTGAARLAVSPVAKGMAQDPSAKVRSVCADALGTIADGKDALVLARLAAACEDGDAAVRRWAVASYAKLAPQGERRDALLARMATDPDSKVAAAAQEGMK